MLLQPVYLYRPLGLSYTRSVFALFCRFGAEGKL